MNILNPPAIPVGDGLSAILNAVSQPIFRDMSGLAGTQQLAQTGLQVSGQNLSNALAAAVETAKLAAGLIVGGPAGGLAAGALNLASGANAIGSGIERRISPATENITNTGALLNRARELDRQASPQQAGAAAETGRQNTATNELSVLRSAIPGESSVPTSVTESTNFLRPAGPDLTERSDDASLPAELQRVAPTLQAAQARLFELQNAGLPSDQFQQAGAQLLKAAYAQAAKPILSAAQGDGTKVDAAFRAFLDFEALTQQFDLSGVSAELIEGNALLKTAIKNALNSENDALAVDGDIRHVQRIDVLLAGANSAGFEDVFDTADLNASVNVTLSGVPATIAEDEVITVKVSATLKLGNNQPAPLSGGRIILTAGGGAPEQLIDGLDGSGTFSGQFSLSPGPLIGTGRSGSTGITIFAAVVSPESALLTGEAQPQEVPGKVTVRFLGGRDPNDPSSALQPSPFSLTNSQQCLTTAPASGTGVAFIAAIVDSGGPQEAAARYDIQIL